MPDVIFMSDIGYTAQLSTRRSNYLLDLTDKVPQALQDEFYPNGNSPCYINGKLLCMRNDIAHMTSSGTTSRRWKRSARPCRPPGKSSRSSATNWRRRATRLGSGVEAFPLYAFLVSDGCDMVMPVEGKDDTVKIDLTTEKCLKPARMIDHMIANGSLTKVGPFDPDFVDLVKAGKVPLMIGPTWFGEYVIKPTYEMARRQARRGRCRSSGKTRASRSPGAGAAASMAAGRTLRIRPRSST